MNCLVRLIALTHNTWLDLMRQRSLNVLLLFGLAIVGAAQFFARFAFEQQLKFIKDISLGSMTLIGTIMAIVSVAMALPSEIESRTLFTTLSKPVRRWEFLVGKYLGVAAMLTCSVVLMGLVFGGVLLLKENSLIQEVQQSAETVAEIGPTGVSSPQADIEAIRRETRDPNLIQAILLIVVKLWLTAAMALLVSTVATSVLFTVAVTAMLLIAGHLQSVAREYWLGASHVPGEWVRWFLAGLALVLPDLSGFTLTDEIVAGVSVSWHQIREVLLYGLSCSIVLVMVACACFHGREL
jgi:hypothetical protein